MPLEFKIELFPDTGFHTYFVPLAVPEGRDKEQKQLEEAHGFVLPQLAHAGLLQLRKLAALGDKAKWEKAKGENLGWLRYRIGKKRYPPKDGLVDAFLDGLWIAVETNTGNRDRGSIWRAEDNLGSTDPAWQKWSRTPEEERPTPYVVGDRDELYDKSKPFPLIDLTDACSLNEFGLTVPYNLRVIWMIDYGAVIKVHLAVDLGNSRTAVLGLQEVEEFGAVALLSQICRPIIFKGDLVDCKERTDQANSLDQNLVPDSWFILRTPKFETENFDPKSRAESEFIEKTTSTQIKKKPSIRNRIFGTQTVLNVNERVPLERIDRLPQMFVALSPTAIGQEAIGVLNNVDRIDRLGLSFLSSPKRYFWDRDAVGGGARGGETIWTMQSTAGLHGNFPEKLKGDMLLFLPVHERDRHYDDPRESLPPLENPNVFERPLREPPRPDFPRADSLIWMALSIIEKADRQINSEAWRNNDNPLLQRKISSVTITFPPGWTQDERVAYFRAWKYARNIFHWSRISRDNKSRPIDVRMTIDEAIASQLPILFADVYHLDNHAKNWILLYGRERGNGGRSVRVMTLDIGGGTSDTAIVEYQQSARDNESGAYLKTRVLFSDSSSLAGDRLIQQVIESVLLPTLGSAYNTTDLQRQFSSNINRDLDAQQAARCARTILIRSVFVPMIVRWFQDIKLNNQGDPISGLAWSPYQCGGANVIQPIERLNDLFKGKGNVISPEAPFSVDYAAIKRIIREFSLKISDIQGRYVAAFDCDLVVLTGKPSELPPLREALEESLPIDLHRLAFAKNYHAGEWFPFKDERGLISDAKLVTVTGAALYRAMQLGLIRDWRIEEGERTDPARNYWGPHSGSTSQRPFDNVYLAPDEDISAPIRISDKAMLGRARFKQIPPEPVYEFRWRGPLREKARQIDAIVTLKRFTARDGKPLPVEHLEIASVDGVVSGRQITLDDVELKLHTLPRDGAQWIDSGRFDVDWESVNAGRP